MNPTKLDHMPSIKYQIKNEKKALEQYLKWAREIHENMNYREFGLIISPEMPYFTVSCDGLVSCNCHGNGCIEIKCLRTVESGDSFDVLTLKPNNILNRVENDYFLERNHEFYYKVQMQINLGDLEYCDFVVWSPIKVLVITINADIDFWIETQRKASTFHEQVLMPELLGKFYTGKTG